MSLDPSNTPTRQAQKSQATCNQHPSIFSRTVSIQPPCTQRKARKIATPLKAKEDIEILGTGSQKAESWDRQRLLRITVYEMARANNERLLDRLARPTHLYLHYAETRLHLTGICVDGYVVVVVYQLVVGSVDDERKCQGPVPKYCFARPLVSCKAEDRSPEIDSA
ncbi:hypothetical protein MBM_07749 [Drepanopeziza brunnea f. sp. 'multigermtubi' MB_m1]|uniref:Uncharacterized protein n=1 Tax=Marssonina brunnea f. sp. multigermtubi (strain MB_m1) TaxID=1072389 RepID=K1WP11_MARBU|nr:uncharacterized protein MBM_07749 [Drepanopeziza brunnea f. sp. 'multigermtubi' MB_m1]EKD14072.1 hypothetical protein MBM_07749 [Drepanopeziza brunnea f. sp. 'multigermtubi' MB_m1]